MILDAGFLGDDILNENVDPEDVAPSDQKVQADDFEASTVVGDNENDTFLAQKSDDADRTVQAFRPPFSDMGEGVVNNGPDTIFDGDAWEDDEVKASLEDVERAEATYRQAKKEMQAGEFKRARVLLGVALKLHEDDRFRALLQKCERSLS